MSNMLTIFAILAILVKQSLCGSSCPHEDQSLQSFASLYPNLQKSDNIAITESVLLDVELVDVTKITISGSGKLVFGRNIDITVKTTGILVQDEGALVMGSKSCRHEDPVHIILEGTRGADQSVVGDTGEKYIAVTDQGQLHIHGTDKLAWTKVTATADRIHSFADDITKVKHIHLTSEYAEKWNGREGLALYVLDADATVADFQVYDLFCPDDLPKEATEVQKLIDRLDSVTSGQLVAISVQNFLSPDESTTMTTLFDKIEEVSGMETGELLLRNLEQFDSYSLIFVKGGSDCLQASDELIAKKTTYTLISVEFAGYKISASCYIDPASKLRSWIDLRILDPSVGYPVIELVHDISSWNIGDEIVITTTDYDPSHGEVRKIKDKPTSKSIKLDHELIYRHFGEIEHRVDMRAEVGLLTRNIKIEGKVSRGCPPTNENCHRVDFDTFGGHLKIYKSFGGAHIQGAEFYHMGQGTQKGTYPIHFHMLLNITGQDALVQGNSIHHTLQRCITVHGTYGTSIENPGVELRDNVIYDALGHCFFLEDGIEMGTILTNNLGAYIKHIKSGFFTTDNDGASVYWITNPKVLMIGNVAAGCEGFGIWYSFPYEPVGECTGMVFQYKEAIHTPIWTCDNNIVHSSYKGGFNFENVVLDNDGNVDHHLMYNPLSDPLDLDSPPVKVQIMRLTAYKNRARNVWIRGGMEFMQFSSAESRMGTFLARGTIQMQQFLKKSIFIGKSDGNYEDEDYPDAYYPAKLKYRFGVGFVYGPQFISDSWFTNFKSADDGSYLSGALSFRPNAEFSPNVMSSVYRLRFSFQDPTEGNRMFAGTSENEELGFLNSNGNEKSSIRDLDGSVYACDEADYTGIRQIVKPEKYLLTDNCQCRLNWQMCICDEAYAAAVFTMDELWSGVIKDFPEAIQAKRINYQDAEDVAYEDHLWDNKTRGRAHVILGDDTYYYQMQQTFEFPKRLDIEMDGGIESGKDVVIGVCLPEGIGQENLILKARSGADITVKDEEFIWGSSLQEVRDDDSMATVFLDGRFLYMHFASTMVRDPYTDFHKCMDEKCPFFWVEVDTELDYTPCFSATKEELNIDNMLAEWPTKDCLYDETSDPKWNWGTGDTYADQDGAWSGWGPWSECIAGEKLKVRFCDSPTPFGNGAFCDGATNKTTSC